MEMKTNSSVKKRKSKLTNDQIRSLLNDPFQGKGGYKPQKITKKPELKVATNENLVFPKGIIKQAMQRAIEKIDPRVYPESYSESLCSKLGEKYGISPIRVVVANGGDTIIDTIVRMTVKKGYSAVIIAPTFSMYEHAIRVQGGEINQMFLSPAPDFKLNLNDILANIHPRKDRLMFLCSPNNPTGNQFDKRMVIKLIAEFPGIVALDEAYASFGRYSMVSSLDEFPNLLIMKTFSKAFGLAGLRIGYSLSSELLATRMKEILPIYNVNSIAIEVAKELLDREDQINPVFNEIITERERVFGELEQIPGIMPFKSDANFILFKTINYTARELHQELSTKGILLRKQTDAPLCGQCLRVTITTKENNNFFLETLEKIINTKN
ncbi:MAG: histidinol-phosphate transaminase [Candidatus Heimdallarchaeota archaeon]|nr:histidinol-phosphate transaminase [Candidatus Heimdallarchaeota archaeon]